MRQRRGENGFAMLFIFLMAGMVAIAFYKQLPRVAFENQRSKEQLLIERGEQYTRAIQLFFRQQKKYPASLDDLEQFNGKRYLRRRYVDPMTGKAEWRIIKIGAGGVFENSLTRKPPSADGKDGKDGKQANVNTFTYEAAAIGSTGASGQPGASAVPQLRPSEQRAAQASGSGILPPGAAGQVPGADPAQQTGGAPPQQQAQQAGFPQGVNPVYPGTGVQVPQGSYPAMPVFPQQPGQPGNTGQPGILPPGQPGVLPVQPGLYPGGFPPNPNQQSTAQQQGSQAASQQSSFVGGGTFIGGPAPAAQTGQPQQGSPGYPGQPVGYGQPGYGQAGAQPYPYSQQPGVQGAPLSFPTPPGGLGQQRTGAGAAGANPAADMIWKSLTTPRTPPNMTGSQQPGMQIGGGIAGVASMMEKSGIKLYNEHDKYNEWEFIYDYSQDKSGQKTQQGVAGATNPGQSIGTSPNSQPGVGAGQGGSSGFGSPGFGSPGFGSSSGFGQSPGAPLGVRSR